MARIAHFRDRVVYLLIFILISAVGYSTPPVEPNVIRPAVSALVDGLSSTNATETFQQLATLQPLRQAEAALLLVRVNGQSPIQVSRPGVSGTLVVFIDMQRFDTVNHVPINPELHATLLPPPDHDRFVQHWAQGLRLPPTNTPRLISGQQPGHSPAVLGERAVS